MWIGFTALAWWTAASLSTAARPESLFELLLLALASLVLLLRSFFYRRAGRLIAFFFTAAFSVLPWLFWTQARLTGLIPEAGVTPAGALLHIITVYNLFRYFLMAGVFLILVWDTKNTIRDYNGN